MHNLRNTSLATAHPPSIGGTGVKYNSKFTLMGVSKWSSRKRLFSTDIFHFHVRGKWLTRSDIGTIVPVRWPGTQMLRLYC